LGVAFSGAQFVGMVKGLIDSADGLNDLATRTGTSVKSLASLQLAAKLADTDLENLGKGLGKLSIFMANNADEAQALGITARDPVEAFAQLADAVAATSDPSERNALAMRVLGKSYAELMPLLVQGGDEMRAQAAAAAPFADNMTKLAEESAKFNDEMDRLKQSANAAGVEIGLTLVPALNKVLERWANAGKLSDAGFGFFDLMFMGINKLGASSKDLAKIDEDIAKIQRRLEPANQKKAAFFGLPTEEENRAELAKLQKLRSLIESFDLTKIGGNRYAGNDLSFIEQQQRAIEEFGALTDNFLPEEEAQKLQATLAKAFNTKPLDDFIASFADKRKVIEKEYAKLTQSLTAQPLGEVKGFDVGNTISQGQGALARGDTAGVEAATERAKQMLAALQENGGADFELRYYADQLKRFELAVLDAGQSTAEQTRDNLQKNLEQAREQIAAMEPIAIPIAADAIANDLRTALDDIRKDLAANPLTVAVQLANTPGGTAQDLRNAALQAGGRR
jgi:hypothetical protein